MAFQYFSLHLLEARLDGRLFPWQRLRTSLWRGGGGAEGAAEQRVMRRCPWQRVAFVRHHIQTPRPLAGGTRMARRYYTEADDRKHHVTRHATLRTQAHTHARTS